MQSMDGPSGNNHETRIVPPPTAPSATASCALQRPTSSPAARVLAIIGAAGLHAALFACSDAAPTAREAAAASPPHATSTAAVDGPWLVNVTDAKREPAGRPLPCPPHVPEALNPPADTTLELAWPASGVQVYACTQAKPSDAPSWSLEGPHALLTSGNSVAAIHFAGPSWQALDGSQVKAAKLASADAPDATAVPWLLLSATPSGEGTFAHTTHIQRLDTSGGKAPASGCDASHLGAKVLVPYRASYYFYRHANGGEAVHQCRAKPAKGAGR